MNDEVKTEETLPAAPENITNLVEAKKGPSKIEQKRIAAQQERFRRLKNKHPELSDDKIIMKMQQEDYEALPDSVKIKRLEGMISASLQGLAQEMSNLHHNDQVIADSFDVNYRAIAKMFLKLGISMEEQKKFTEEAQIEFETASKAEYEARMAAMKKAEEAKLEKAEHSVAEAELKKAEMSPASFDANGAPIPEEATTFGG